MSTKYDIVLVGGGMVGLACAASLADTSLSIAVIENRVVDMEWPPNDYDLRVSAITRESENLLRKINVWKNITTKEKTAYQSMYVWDGESSRGAIEFNASLIGEENLGHIVENRVLRRSIFEKIQECKKIDFLCPESCKAVTYSKNSAELTLTSGNKLEAKLLIAADGAMSWLRKASKIDIQIKPYGHQAIVCNLATEKKHALTAYQRFGHDGPLAFLPLPELNACSIVWSVTQDKVKDLLQMDDKDFIEQLEHTFEKKLGGIKSISKRISFPLFERTAESMVRDRLALIGDAAHTIHPLAGQGVNLGFSDARILSDLIIESLDKKKDFGTFAQLRKYERARKGDVFLMQQAMNGFKQLFASQQSLVQMLRSYGLNKLNQHSLIKQQLIKKALGL